MNGSEFISKRGDDAINSLPPPNCPDSTIMGILNLEYHFLAKAIEQAASKGLGRN